ncbi:MAG: PhzF family phenazine biosynthesis protein [Hyphomicrobiaceae bacterium]
MRSRRFIQCDVFTSEPTKGNGLAVVIDGDGLSDRQMQDFAAWTNLAETTFLLAPTTSEADYKVRIFTPAREMLFAGHPTLGSCASWLTSGGRPKTPGVVKQECGVGIVAIDVSGAVPAFAAPPTKIAPMAPEKLHAITTALGIKWDRIVRTSELNNGPTWQALELKSADDVLAIDSSKVRYPQFVGIGLIGAHPAGSDCHYEARMLAPSSGMSEDPITGSMNAAVACWMYGEGHWTAPVKVAQGTAINRTGRIHIHRDLTGTIWIGGQTCMLIEGTLRL